MKEQMARELLEIIRGVKGGVLKGLEFAQSQVPDLIQEIILFHRVYFLVTNLFLALLCLTCIYLLVRKIKYDCLFGEYDTPTFDFAKMIFFGFSSIISVFMFLAQIRELLLVFLAPKLFLIEYLGGVLK